MQFITHRKKFYVISASLFVISILVFFLTPKNLGIDMTGGLQIEYTTTSAFDEKKLESIREKIMSDYTFEDKKVLSDVLVYNVNTTDIRADIGLLTEDDVVKAKSRSADLRARMPKYFSENGIEVVESSFVSVGKSFGAFVLNRAYLNIVMCLVAIALYLMYAFRKSIEGTSGFSFGAITLATLLHDVIIASGIYIILGQFFPGLKIDTFFVTAILTILGYSINDTIVILDRIRGNYRDKRSHDKRTDKEIFESSIQVSLRRSIYTSLMLVIVLICMLIFGPEALKGFVTLMLLGATVGTYSSIAIAAPLLYDINSRQSK